MLNIYFCLEVDEDQQGVEQQGIEDETLEEVWHNEPAAYIPPAEAAEIAQHQWAQAVQRLATTPAGLAAAITDPEASIDRDTSAAALLDTPECFLP